MRPEEKKSTIFTICSQMSGFCYDSAKELSDREKDAVKSSKPPLAGLMAAFSQLCVIEKQYYSLTFLMPKRFLMKDTALNTAYTAISSSLKKVEEWRSSSLTRDLATQLMTFIEARLEFLKLYETIANAGANFVTLENTPTSDSIRKNIEECVIPIDTNLAPTIINLARKYKDCLKHEYLKPLNDLLLWELDCLHGLFSCLHHLNHWRYMEALIEMDKAKNALKDWLHSLQTHTETRSLRLLNWFRSSSPTPSMSSQVSTEDHNESVNEPSEKNHNYVEPALFTWFTKLRSHVLAKLTLYFHSTLAEHTTAEIMEEKCAKLVDDIPGKIQSNLKRLEITYAVLVFDATTEVGYKGPGFHHPEIKKDSPRGLNLYPCAYACPEKPQNLWPSIVMCVDEFSHLNNWNKIAFSYDSRVSFISFSKCTFDLIFRCFRMIFHIT